MGITLIMMIDLDDCHDVLYVHDDVHLNTKETVDTQPMSFPTQRIVTAFGSSKQFIIL
jgi:hypothetical protein